MKKIIELLIEQDDIQLEQLGVDILSIVENPAIGVNFFAFSEEDVEYFETDGPYVEDTFESYTDYPESVKEAAQRGIRLNEDNDNKCATQTGKVRAQQLAKGEPISVETIKRMYSYLSRAETYYDPSDTSACGTISYLLWGGESALGWSKRKLDQIQKEQMSSIIEKLSEELGEEHDTTLTTYINEDQFQVDAPDTVAQIGDALKALDLLGRRDSEERGKTVYKYEGPTAERRFCKALLRASRTKFFTRGDLQQMQRNLERYNPNMGRGGSDTYDIFKYGGGVNCKHHFQQYKMFKDTNGRTLLIQTNVRTTPMSSRPNGGRVNFEGMEPGKLNRMDFQVLNEEQRIVVGPAMIPSSLIPRRDQNGMEYFVYFSKDTIKNISEKFFQLNYHNNTDINHDNEVTTNNTLLESWIVEDSEIDKSRLYGYEPIEGSWFLSYRINDDDTWNKIKNGELKGYSISGNFLEKQV